MGFKARPRSSSRSSHASSRGYSGGSPPKSAAKVLQLDKWALKRDADRTYTSARLAIESGAFDKVINSWSPMKDKPIDSILRLALKTRDTSLVEAVLLHGADPERSFVAKQHDAPNRHEPPIVSHANRPEIVRLLLKYGAKVDAHLPSIGRTALWMAVADSCRESVKVLLDAGADPLFGRGGKGDTPYSLTSRKSGLRALLEKAMEQQAEIKVPLFITSSSAKSRLTASKSRGIRAFVYDMLKMEEAWGVTLVAAPLREVSSGLHKRYRGSKRIEAPASAIPDALGRVIFCVGFRGMPWTVCYEVVEEHLYTGQFELASARNISKQLQCEAIAFGCWDAVRFTNGVKAEQQLWEPETIAERDNIAIDSSRAFDRFEAQQLQAMDSWFVAHDVLVPPMSYIRDGVTISARFSGIPTDAVEGIDVVVCFCTNT